MKLVPCMSNCAIQALLSPARETWQSVHVFVSLPRTVWGTKVLKAWPLNPSAETVCCCSRANSRFGILRTDEHGAGGTHRRDAIASYCSVDTEHVNIVAQDLEIVRGLIARGEAFVVQHGHLRFAVIGRWQPKQVGVQEVWQV